MKKYPIGFHKNVEEFEEIKASVECTKTVAARPSVVEVYFPHRKAGWTYYNDRFDLKVGDLVYVEGKLEGYRGRVTKVSYAFKIKLEDYKKVIAVVDTTVVGALHFAYSHFVSFDKNALPYDKVRTWFKAPEPEAVYVSGDDDSVHFPLDDLSKMRVSSVTASRGEEYFMDNRVAYLELDGKNGRAIVEGSEPYEVEFSYSDGEISNLKCSCFCGCACKHAFATMLQLRETLEFVLKHYEAEFDDYFAAISERAFFTTVLNGYTVGTLRLEGVRHV